MKRLKSLAIPFGIVAALSVTTHAVAGGTFVQKYIFPVVSGAAPSGAWPDWELTKDASAAVLYGVTPSGGTLKGGTLFKVTTSGSFTKIREFGPHGDVTGSQPNGPVLLVGSSYYGVTQFGGSNDKGVLYKWTPSSGAYQVVYHFGSGTAAATPSGPMLLATDGNVYGTSLGGGACGQGTIYKLAPSTGAVSVLYSLCTTDGTSAMTGVIQASDGALYGTAYTGGPGGYGTLFRVTLAGTFTRLHSFGATLLDAKYPGRLLQAKDGLLYGSSYAGGDSANGLGTIFSSTLSGALTVRAAFASAPNGMTQPSPWAGLNERFTGIFYGVTYGQNSGNVFQFRATNNSLSNIYAFTQCAASWPKGGLTLGPDGNLWGATTDGETLYCNRAGTLFNIQSLTANP